MTHLLPPPYSVARVNEILRAATKDKPKSDQREIDANGDQLRTDAADLVFDNEAWLARLHNLQGKELPTRLAIESQPTERAARPAHSESYRPAETTTTDSDDLYLDDAAWHAHLHSLCGKDLLDEAEYRARERAFKAGHGTAQTIAARTR
jgi:FtsZ-binding cell division protein ZapB